MLDWTHFSIYDTLESFSASIFEITTRKSIDLKHDMSHSTVHKPDTQQSAIVQIPKMFHS